MNKSSQQSVLVVDDDLSLTAILTRALERRGFSVTAANTAGQALAAAREREFGKAILDLKLAESSGLQLLPELLALQPRMQVVMLTGYSSIATAVEAIKQGAHNYLCKPADVDEILAAFSDSGHVEAGPVEAFTPPSVDRLEWEHIQRVLQEHEGNISATARALGMHRRTLQRKLNKRPVRR
ncbi:response regulator [Proteobacteria bacterium 005FR1]|nr:response regulator [Proteobacteria bacterium 005FR1]